MGIAGTCKATIADSRQSSVSNHHAKEHQMKSFKTPLPAAQTERIV
jgi:hypothetical protein